MKVRELMELLAGFNPESEVILQADAEGNGYSPLAAVDHDAIYVPQNSWAGDVYSTEWTADDACMEEREWRQLLKRKRCVVLAPVN